MVGRLRAFAASICLVAILPALGSCGSDGGEGRSRDPLANVEDGSDWAGYGRTYDENHFSPLTEINAGNVDRLGLAWSLDLPTAISTHTAPLAIDGVLYFATGLSVVQAVDAVSGKELWSYDPKVFEVAGQKLRGSWGIRGIAYWNGHVLTGTVDGRLISIDAKTGAEAWSVQTTMGPDDGRSITGAPRVFGDKVIIGHGGADFSPVRGYVTAYDVTNGKQLWRFFTVPGNPAEGFEDEAMRMAAKTWTGDWWKFGGGGTVWNAITYDPELDRIYIGTGNGSPWNRAVRSPGGGDNLFLCSVVALDAKTGKYVWHYQTVPGETWDFNSSMDMELATLTIDGKPRRVIMHAPKNGFFYVLDRDTGKLISAKQLGRVTWATGIDQKTGRPIENPAARNPGGKTLIFPSSIGLHNWYAMAFSKKTGLVYVPTSDVPGEYDATGITPNWRPTKDMQLNTGYNLFRTRAQPDVVPANLGALKAWDPVTQKEVWSVPMSSPFNGGVTVTAGDLVFQGDAMGQFVAYDAGTGKALWRFDAQNGILAQPITYRAGGKQYVTVITGFGGTAAGIGPQVAQYGWDYRNQKRRVLTFVLDGKSKLPPVEASAPVELVRQADLKLEDAMIDKGVAVYAQHCFICHGLSAVAGGGAPDLRHSQAVADAATFSAIVKDGGLEMSGMPKFDTLNDNDLLALRQYIAYRARNSKALPAPKPAP